MMDELAFWLLIINFLLLALTVINIGTVRTVKSHSRDGIKERVSILLPLRNEANNVAGLMSTVLSQKGLDDFEVIALDDNSTDDTAAKLLDSTAANLTVINGEKLPTGWLGKNFACHQLAQRANGDYLVFVDADVRLSSFAVADSIHLMKKLHWDFISPYPKQIAITFLERVAQPLLQWSWFATLPLRLAERLRRPSMVVANGQFLIIKSDSYKKSGGHEAVRAEVLDDMELARLLIRAGAKGGVADGSKVAECRMYSSAAELIEGYSKSQWRAFVNPAGAFLVIFLLFVTSIFPLLLGLSGVLLGWYGYFVIVITRLLVAAKTRSVISSAVLHPISAGLWIYLIINSWLKKSRGNLTWRGRSL